MKSSFVLQKIAVKPNLPQMCCDAIEKAWGSVFQ